MSKIVVVSNVGIQGPAGTFIYNVDGGTPTSTYNASIKIDAGGVSS